MNYTKQKKDKNYKENLNKLFNLRIALSNCVFMREDIIEKTDLNLQFTPLGERLINHLTKKHSDKNVNLIKLAVFIDFYHEDLYLKIAESDISNVEKQISKWIVDESIRYPWVYGKDLYDKYYTDFETQEEELDYEETCKLLKNTYKGVFQINELIISPFGLLKSKVKRRHYPELEMKLWHCSDPSCSGFHTAQFYNSDDSLILSLLNKIDLYNSKKDVFDIENDIENKIDDDDEYFNPNNLRGTYELLGNSFGAEEHKNILQSIIEKENIRDLLPSKIRKGSALEIVQKMTKDQCFSLILIVDDKIIFEHIDRLIDEKIIIIPDTEIRESHSRKGFGQYRSFIQCNKLGLRVNSKFAELSLARLRKLIKEVNSESPYREQLEWKLRDFNESSSIDHKISNFIVDQTPQKAIHETIYTGPVQLEKTFGSLPGYFSMPNSQESEIKLIEKIAWKLGFSINLYPSFIEDFWNNLSKFKADVFLQSTYNEGDKSKIRSSAVNLFVSMEEILQQSLSFIAWALLSDHYLESKFIYVYEDARQFMISKLDNFEYSSDQFLKFDKSGKNTLFPLINGFNALTKLCDQIIIDKEKYKRKLSEFPSYYNNDPLKVFPFEHKIFLLDLKALEYQKIKTEIKSISSEFGKGKILDIRNRLQHNREDFPSQQEILEAITSIEKSFSILENEGLYPNVYLFDKSITDEYKRTKISVKNYKGNLVNFYVTPELIGLHIPNAHKPLIVIDHLMIGLTNHPVVFRYKEKSSYQAYWKDYPKKKIINN